MTVGSSLRRGWLFTIKHSLNPLTKSMARRGSKHLSIVRTVGRKTGKTFETPIIVRPVEGGFVCELTYGPDVNWYRNLVAAGGVPVCSPRRVQAKAQSTMRGNSARQSAGLWSASR